MTRRTEAFGRWPSPVSAELIGSLGLVGPTEVWPIGDGLLWLDDRPLEQGRCVVVHQPEGGPPRDVTPAGFSARTTVHEYGGGSYWVAGEDVLFCNQEDQRVYRQPLAGGTPAALTPLPPRPRSVRYADGDASPRLPLSVAVRETHAPDGSVRNELVAISHDGSQEVRLVATGRDFYAYPRFSPDGARICWLAWDHPAMPWDDSELWTAPVDAEGRLGEPVCVAGKPLDGVEQALFGPVWSPQGVLHYVGDRSGWWRIHREDRDEPLTPQAAELGVPLWTFRRSTFDFLPDGRLACLVSADGFERLGVLVPATGALEEVPTPFTCFFPASCLRVDARGRVVVVAASSRHTQRVVVVDPASGEYETLGAGERVDLPEGYVSEPEAIAFPGYEGATAYGLFHPPVNRDVQAPEGELPPLVVYAHGGPTSQVLPGRNPATHFFTSRGFAVMDVNYGGSSGYGRAYRERLRGMWGLVDAGDCIGAARHLVETGRVDPGRLAIRGESAGGYTVLSALAFHDVFHVGASHFGVSDLRAFVATTHKFESRYVQRLVGSDVAGEQRLDERSPLRFADRLRTPLVVLQGGEDAVVPPQQAELIVAALERNGVPHRYLLFPEEGHGFRDADNRRAALEAELAFYEQALRLVTIDATAEEMR